jgi:hypothetical protein
MSDEKATSLTTEHFRIFLNGRHFGFQNLLHAVVQVFWLEEVCCMDKQWVSFVQLALKVKIVIANYDSYLL